MEERFDPPLRISKSNLDLPSPANKVLLSLKLSYRYMCWPSLLGACYTIQYVGCCEFICDLYQSFAHQLWVGSTSDACGASVEFSTGTVCSPSHFPPPSWRTHYAISISLITPVGPSLPLCCSLLFLFFCFPSICPMWGRGGCWSLS